MLELSLVGNPIMHHLVFGLDPRARLGAVRAGHHGVGHGARLELSLGVHPGARVYAPPCIAGHVGADAAAMVLAEGPHHGDALTLLVDVGTNAEIVLGNRRPAAGGLVADRAGLRGRPDLQWPAGRSRRDRAGPDRPRDARAADPGGRLASSGPTTRRSRAVRRTGITGICGSGIIEAIAELFLAGVIGADGPSGSPPSSRVVAHDRTFSYRLWDDPVIEVTQADVRAIQLAKARCRQAADC